MATGGTCDVHQVWGWENSQRGMGWGQDSGFIRFESFEALVINLDGPKRLPCDTSDFVTFGAAISRNASVCRSVRCPGAEAETLRHGVLQVELPGRVVAAKVLHNQESKAQLLEPGFGEKEDTVVALCWETVALGTVLSFGRN